MKRKIIKQFIKINLYTQKLAKYLTIKVFNEPTQVGNLKFRANHVYNVPSKNKNDLNKYQQPYSDSDYNVKHDFNLYRKKLGLLTPKQIKVQRRHYHLTQRELAAILGLGFATISRLERNEIVQSISQDSALRNLLNPIMTIKLIDSRLPIIKDKHSKYVSDLTLRKKAARINKLA